MEKNYLHEGSEINMDMNLQDAEYTVPYLPEELIISIVVRLPAKVLHRSMKLVCRHWANIIRDPLFIEAHLRQSKTGLFIRDRGSQCLEIEGDEFKVTDVRCQFPGRLIGGCDGVLLITDSNNPKSFSVANPVTMQVTMLPNLEVPLNSLYDSTYILHVPSIRKFKLVHLYEDLRSVFRWVVVTVGIDNSWRKIDVQQAFDRHHIGMNWFAVPAGEVVYWPELDFQLDGTRYFLGMDMVDETTYNVPVPFGSVDPCAYVKMGDYLSCFKKMGSVHFEIFVLKNMQRGEWVKAYDINVMISGRIPLGLTLVLPVCWLKNNDILILEAITSQEDVYLAYDVKKKEIRTMNLSTCCRHFNALIHTDSLLSW